LANKAWPIKYYNTLIKQTKTTEINNIEDQKWIKHYQNLWCTSSPQDDDDEPEATSTPPAGIDEISDEELERSLKLMKNRKAAGPDGLNSELFK